MRSSRDCEPNIHPPMRRIPGSRSSSGIGRWSRVHARCCSCSVGGRVGARCRVREPRQPVSGVSTPARARVRRQDRARRFPGAAGPGSLPRERGAGGAWLRGRRRSRRRRAGGADRARARGSAGRRRRSGIDARVIGYAAAAAAAATLAFAAVPAWRVATGTLGAHLREGTRTAGSSSGRTARRWLVGVEVALAIALVTLMVLLSQSFARLQAVDPGFRADHLLTVRLSLPRAIPPPVPMWFASSIPCAAAARDAGGGRGRGRQRRSSQWLPRHAGHLAGGSAGTTRRRTSRGALPDGEFFSHRRTLAYRSCRAARWTHTISAPANRSCS